MGSRLISFKIFCISFSIFIFHNRKIYGIPLSFILFEVPLRRSVPMCFYRDTVSINFHLWLRLTVFHLWKVDKHPYLILLQFDKVLSILVAFLCHVALLRLYRNTI